MAKRAILCPYCISGNPRIIAHAALAGYLLSRLTGEPDANLY